MEQKPKRLRFSYTDDIVFLREVVAENPFSDSSLWERIQNNIEIATGKLFSIKTLKNHLELLLEFFLKKDAIDKVRSGVEEPYCEKDHLLQEVALISSEFKENIVKHKKIPSKEKQISDLGKKARDKYSSVFREELVEVPAEDISEEIIIDSLTDHSYVRQDTHTKLVETTDAPNTSSAANTNAPTVNKDTTPSNEPPTKTSTEPSTEPSTSRPRKNVIGPTRIRYRKEATIRKNAISYLTDKLDSDRRVKEKELEIENKKIELEKRKLTLEEEKLKVEAKKLEIQSMEITKKIKIYEEKWEMDIEHKRVTTQLLLAQQKIIDNFIKDKNNSK